MKDTTVDDFLVNSQELIETAIELSNTGLVSMTLETTISTSNREVQMPISLMKLFY